MIQALLLAALWAAAQPDRQACPPGWSRVPTREHNEPFHCRRQMDPSTPFIEMTPNYRIPHCPQGYSPIKTPGELQRFRCVRDAPRPTGEPLVPPALTGKSNPKARQDGRLPSAAVLDYTPYQMSGVMAFDYPKDWHLTDAWRDEVPTVYIEYDTGRQGRQPTLVVTRYAKGQEGWVDLETAVAQEKEFQNSKELPSSRVAGLRARMTAVASESRAAYVDVGKEEYYVLSYSAPEDLFTVFEPAYKRLLASFRLSRRAAEAR